MRYTLRTVLAHATLGLPLFIQESCFAVYDPPGYSMRHGRVPQERHVDPKLGVPPPHINTVGCVQEIGGFFGSSTENKHYVGFDYTVETNEGADLAEVIPAVTSVLNDKLGELLFRDSCTDTGRNLEVTGMSRDPPDVFDPNDTSECGSTSSCTPVEGNLTIYTDGDAVIDMVLSDIQSIISGGELNNAHTDLVKVTYGHDEESITSDSNSDSDSDGDNDSGEVTGRSQSDTTDKDSDEPGTRAFPVDAGDDDGKKFPWYGYVIIFGGVGAISLLAYVTVGKNEQHESIASAIDAVDNDGLLG